MMPRSLRCWILCSALVLLTGATGHVAAMVDARTTPAALEIALENGLLTLRARDAPLGEVVQAIGEHVGFETIVLGALEMRVDISFSELPLTTALERVLGNSSRVVVSAPEPLNRGESDIVRIWLLGSGESGHESLARNTAHAVENDLQDPDVKRRSEAMLRLGIAPATAAELEALALALQNDEEALVRSRAAIALGALRDERAVLVLEVALLDENSSVRVQAIHALSKIGGERATSALGGVLLHGKDSVQRVVAAQSLAAQNTVLARQYLDAVAEDPDAQIRAASKSPSTGPQSAVSESRPQVDRLGAEIMK